MGPRICYRKEHWPYLICIKNIILAVDHHLQQHSDIILFSRNICYACDVCLYIIWFINKQSVSLFLDILLIGCLPSCVSGCLPGCPTDWVAVFLSGCLYGRPSGWVAVFPPGWLAIFLAVQLADFPAVYGSSRTRVIMVRPNPEEASYE